PSGFDEAGAVFAVSVLGLGFEEGADLEVEFGFSHKVQGLGGYH
ncbi:unnamed protein product, partial [marine sediment metagenome]